MRALGSVSKKLCPPSAASEAEGEGIVLMIMSHQVGRIALHIAGRVVLMLSGLHQGVLGVHGTYGCACGNCKARPSGIDFHAACKMRAMRLRTEADFGAMNQFIKLRLPGTNPTQVC